MGWTVRRDRRATLAASDCEQAVLTERWGVTRPLAARPNPDTLRDRVPSSILST